MKVLSLDYVYYKFPQNISNIKEFISYATQHYHSFIPLIQYQTDNCLFPYLIEEDTQEVYVNVAKMYYICVEEATIIPTRKEYDDRLKKIVLEKCVNCENYEEDFDGDNLCGHRNQINLDGKCWRYKKKDS